MMVFRIGSRGFKAHRICDYPVVIIEKLLYNKIENFSKLLSFSSCEHVTKSSRVPYLFDSEKPCAPLARREKCIENFAQWTFFKPFLRHYISFTMELKLRRNNQLVTREEREDKALHNKTVLGRVGHDLNCICYDTTHAPFSENKDGELM